MAVTLPIRIAQVLLLLLASTVVFDVIHFLLHRFSGSRSPALRRIGALHDAHHAFLDRDLKLHDEYLQANLRRHVIPEYLTQISVSACCLWFLPAAVVVPTMGVQTLVFLLILRCRGKDINHREIDVLRAYRPMYFCVPAYHALHHIFPNAYFSSWIKTLDHVLGSGVWLAGRRVTLTGASGEFGSTLRRLLERSGVTDLVVLEPGREADPERSAELRERLRDTDILVLCHGTSDDDPLAADGGSYVKIIELFREITRDRRFPVEVWAMDSRGRASDRGESFAGHARRYYFDGRIIYRHIRAAPAAWRPGSTPSRSALAARLAFFFIKRGFNYVPVTGAAALDFFRFRFFTRPLPAH